MEEGGERGKGRGESGDPDQLPREGGIAAAV